MIIYLVRHGEVEEKYKNRFKGKIDCELSEEGKKVSETNAEFLLSEEIDLVVTSGLKRTDYIGELLSLEGINHLKFPEFAEIDFGLCSGKTWDEIEAEFPEVAQMYKGSAIDIKYPEGETMQQAIQRVIKGWNKLIKLDFQKVVIVGHSGVNGILFAYLKDQDISSVKTQPTGDILTLKINV